MSQKSKDDMWCRRCQETVVGVKNTHRIWNTAAFIGTGGIPFLASRIEPYRCPTCGGPTVHIGWHQLAVRLHR